METDASGIGLGAVLSQVQEDGRPPPIAFASRALSPCKKNYGITELETLAVVWSVSHFRSYLYGQEVMVYTNHSAVGAVLQKPGAGGKHARWWLKVHGSGVKNVSIRYRPGRENSSADALSRSPVGSVPPENTDDMPVTVTPICTGDNSLTVSDLLEEIPDAEQSAVSVSLKDEQRKDPKILELIKYLEDGTLPCDEKQCHRVVAQSICLHLWMVCSFMLTPRGSIRSVQ